MAFRGCRQGNKERLSLKENDKSWRTEMKKILVVEDDRGLREGIELALRRDGFVFFCVRAWRRQGKNLRREMTLI